MVHKAVVKGSNLSILVELVQLGCCSGPIYRDLYTDKTYLARDLIFISRKNKKPSKYKINRMITMEKEKKRHDEEQEQERAKFYACMQELRERNRRENKDSQEVELPSFYEVMTRPLRNKNF